MGEEYAHKNGQVRIRSKPSLLKKLDYVENNIVAIAKRYCFDSSRITQFNPLVVIIDYPPIREYGGAKMISINDGSLGV